MYDENILASDVNNKNSFNDDLTIPDKLAESANDEFVNDAYFTKLSRCNSASIDPRGGDGVTRAV